MNITNLFPNTAPPALYGKTHGLYYSCFCCDLAVLAKQMNLPMPGEGWLCPERSEETVRKIDEKYFRCSSGTGIGRVDFARMDAQGWSAEGYSGEGEHPFFVELRAHQYRVASVAAELYRRWVLANCCSGPEAILYGRALVLAALLHDIGKICIDQDVFLTNRPLTSREYRLVQQHPVLGAQMLGGPCSPVGEVVHSGVLHHHQKWGGGGYPGRWRGVNASLRGRDIPLVARIIAIADVYDALKMKRSYKESWQEERIYREIRGQSGRQFDPHLVNLFLDRGY